MAKQGRPTTYSQDIADRICERLAAGETLRRICRDEAMPPESTVRLWYVDDREGFAAQYARARDIGLDVMADELMDVADDGANDYMKREDPDNPGYVLNGEHIQRSRLRIDTRKWYLSKLAPKRYGDKLTTEHTGPDGGPIEIGVTERSARIAGLLAVARRRSASEDPGEDKDHADTGNHRTDDA